MFTSVPVPSAIFANRNNSSLRDSRIHGLFGNHFNLELLCLAKITERTEVNLPIPNYVEWKKTLQFGMNHVVSNEIFWYKAESFKFNWLTGPLTK